LLVDLGKFRGCLGSVSEVADIAGGDDLLDFWTDQPRPAKLAVVVKLLLVTDGETEESFANCEPLAGFNFVWDWLVFFQSGVAFKLESRQ